jgi:hypothetical protein
MRGVAGHKLPYAADPGVIINLNGGYALERAAVVRLERPGSGPSKPGGLGG